MSSLSPCFSFEKCNEGAAKSGRSKKCYDLVYHETRRLTAPPHGVLGDGVVLGVVLHTLHHPQAL